MTTTPEQQRAWREDAKSKATEWWNADHKLIFTRSVLNGYEAGYLRRCQETEQAIKDAHDIAIQECLLFCREEMEKGNATAEQVETRLLELLND